MRHATLYDYPMSGNGWKVRTLLRALERPFRIVWVDILAGEQFAEPFRARNPIAQIPVLELEDGTPLSDSGAILVTVGAGTWLSPAEHGHAILEWLFFQQTWIDGVISRARFRRRFPDVLPTPPVFFEAWAAEGGRALETLERALTGRRYLVADRPTLADIAVYAYTHVADEAGFDLGAFPSLTAWHARLAAEPWIRSLDDNPEATVRDLQHVEVLAPARSIHSQE